MFRRDPQFIEYGLISKDMSITGDIMFSGKLMIEGAVHGQVTGLSEQCASTSLTIAASGSITGDVTVPCLIVDGAIKGRITVETAEFRQNAHIDGPVSYRSIKVIQGSAISGQMICIDDTAATTPATCNLYPVKTSSGA